MKGNVSILLFARARRMFELACLLLSTSLLCAQPQTVPPQPVSPASAISQSGLLPMFAIDLEIDRAWVDGSRFPSSSAKYPNNGTSGALQQTWELLKQGGFNVVRFSINPGDGQSATRMANLCAWAKVNGVLLLPVLDLESSKSSPAESTAAFVKSLVEKMRHGNGEQLAAYSQISYYQIGDRLNHVGLHRGRTTEQVRREALEVAEALRKSEAQALESSNLQPTPIMVNCSYDYELIRQGAIAGLVLDPDTQNKANAAISEFVAPFISSGNVDAINIEWLPGSISAGAVDGFAAMLQELSLKAAGKQIVLTTGFSAAFHTVDEQRQFLVLVSTNLADLRAAQGANAVFVGVIFRNGLSRAEPQRSPEPDISQWQWPQRARELQELWSEGKGSAEIKWWLAKTEAGLGLVKLNSSNTPAALPGLETFQQIASSAQQAVQTVTTAASPTTSITMDQQYPGAPQVSNAGQALPTGTNTGYPAVGQQAPGGYSSSTPTSNAQQLLFGILSQFTTQLSTALASRIQFGRNSSQTYGATNNFYPGSSSYVPSGNSNYAGGQPPMGGSSGVPTGDPGNLTPGTASPSGNYPDPSTAAGAGTPGSDSGSTGTTGSAGANSNVTPRGQRILKRGMMPKIVGFGLMKDATPAALHGKPQIFIQNLILQLSNPTDLMSTALKAELRMDNKTVASNQVAPLLPRQSRSIIFAIPIAPGTHNFQLGLTGPGGKATAKATVNAGAKGNVNGTRAATFGVGLSRPGTNLSAVKFGGASATLQQNMASRSGVRVTLPGIRRTAMPVTASNSNSSSNATVSSRFVPSGKAEAATGTGRNTRASLPGISGKSSAVAQTQSPTTALVRPGPGKKAGNSFTSSSRSNQPGSSNNVARVRSGSSHSTAKSIGPGNGSAAGGGASVLPPRPGPGTGNSIGKSASTTNASSGLPSRPGQVTNTAKIGSRAATPTSASTAKATTAVANSTCVPSTQASQQKNLPACKPGQTTNCAKPICK